MNTPRNIARNVQTTQL